MATVWQHHMGVCQGTCIQVVKSQRGGRQAHPPNVSDHQRQEEVLVKTGEEREKKGEHEECKHPVGTTHHGVVPRGVGGGNKWNGNHLVPQALSGCPHTVPGG